MFPPASIRIDPRLRTAHPHRRALVRTGRRRGGAVQAAPAPCVTPLVADTRARTADTPGAYLGLRA